MRVLPTATATLVYLFVFHLQAHAACTPTEITSAVIWNSNMALTGDCGVRILNGGSLQINAGVTVTVGATLQNRPAIEVYGGQLVIKGTNPSRVTFVGESGFTGVFIEADQDGSSNAPTLDVAYTEFNGDIGAPLGPRGITVSYVGVKGNPVAWKGLTMANLYSGLEVANTAAIKVVDSQFSNIAEQAISVGTASEVYVQRSTFSGMFAGILGWQTGAIKEVIGCTFKEVGRKNPTDNNGWAIRSTVDGLSGVTISNNVILMDAEAIGAIEFKIISNATIEHNTIAAAVGLSDSPSNGTAVRIVSIGSPLTFSGNLLWGWTRGFDADFEGGVTVRMNAAYHSICGFYDRVQDNCDSNSWLNVYWGPGNTWRLDPKFRDLLGGDLRLQPDSPFIDIVDAADATLPGTDPDGNPRLLGQYDLGAYESPLLDPIDDAFVYLPRDGKVRTIVLTGHNLKAEYTSVEILTTDGQLDPKVTVKPKSIQDIGAQPTHLRLNVVAATDAEPGERWVRVKNNPNDPGFILKTVGEKKSLFVARVPTVTTVEPNVGQPGQTLHLTITGTDFPDTVGEVDLDIGGLPLTVDSVESNTTIKATLQLPESATLASYNVTLTNRSGGASHTLSAGFTVEKKTPMVANITPTKGVVGHSYDVIITGQSFDDSADPTVSFGADTNTVVKVRTEKQLTVTVTITGAATPGMRSLTVTNPDGGTVSVSNAFEVQANTPPSTPELDLMPGLTVSNDGTITLTQTPTDDTPIPGDPTLTYTCVYSTNSDLSAPVEITSSTDGTCAPDTSKLTEDVVYYVQVTVKDADGAESTSTPGQLLYSAVNHAPSTPLPQTPSDDTVLNDTMVSFTFSSASDPEQESITYRLQVSQKGSAFPLIDLAGIAATTDPIQTVALTEALEEDVIYTWRVQAVDPHGKASAWSAELSFRIDTQNQTPTVPTPVSPKDGAVVATLTPTLVFASSTDGDKDPVRYIVEIDKVATFDGVDKITVNVNDSGAAEIMLALQTELTEDTTYYWRVRADDGEAKSNFSETAEFVVNATNEVPGAPTPLTPSNDSVQSGPLTLTVQNAADPDGDGLTYEFVLALDSGLTQRVAQIGGVAQGTTTTALSLNQLVLSPDTTYYWAARVTDTHGATSDWSSVFSFSTPLSAADVESGDIDSGELPDVEADTTSTDGTPDDDAGDDIAPTPDTTSNDSVTPQNDTGGPQIDGSATVDASENQNSGGGGSCQTAPLANVDPFALLLLLSAFIAVLARQRPASHRRSALHLR